MKENEMKEKTKKEYKGRLRLTPKSKMNGRNRITAINTWAVAIFRYGAEIICWRESELKSIDRKTRKNLTMYGAMHLKSDVDRLYMKRKEGGRGLINGEQCVKGEENSLGFYVANSEELLMMCVRIRNHKHRGNNGEGRIQEEKGRRAETKMKRKGNALAIR